jgi:hypothetical protein
VRAIWFAAAVTTSLALAEPAAVAQNLVITDTLEQTHAIDLAAVMQLPAVEETVEFATGRGPERATYTGALLWSVLQGSGALAGDERLHLRRTVAVTGRDGYVAVLALAEIDPQFEGKQVLLAYRRDGRPMPDNELRLVVPGDKRGGRSVREVVRIEVRQ